MSPSEPRVGYVLKMYPRLSETFVVNEIAAVEACGLPVEVFSLRAPVDGRFHASLSRVRATVTWVQRPIKLADAWPLLRDASARLPGLAGALEDLLDEEPSDAVQAVEVADLAVRREVTHLHAHFGTLAATVARLASRLTGIPYSFTAHAKDVYVPTERPDVLRRNLAGAARVVTVSDYNVAHLEREHGLGSSVARIYNGLDLDEFPFAGSQGRLPRVVAVGRLVEKKGFSDLLEAMALLRAQGRPVPLDLVGSGPLEDDLRRQVARLGLTDLVRWYGPLTQDEVRAAVRRAAVLAAPCVVAADGNRDGLPTVVLEAMALGTPVVSTPVTGIPEAVRDGVTGLLVPQRSPAELAAALRRLLDDAELGDRLARRARALVEVQFDSTRQALALRQVFTGSVVSAALPGVPAAHQPEPQLVASR